MEAQLANVRAHAARLDHEWDERAIDWPLTQDSIVVEVGGYTGRWALQIAERYHPRLFVFEPQPWAADVCRKALGEAATVLSYGLGSATAMLSMGEWETDGCSFIKEGTTSAWMHEVGAAFRELAIAHIDLMLMNIEGYEYTLIPHMLDHGILPRRLMVQFHPFTDEQKAIQAQIYERLAALGYTIPWSYGVILTAWECAV